MKPHATVSRFPIHITAGRERRTLCGNTNHQTRPDTLRTRTLRTLFCTDCARIADAHRNNLIAALSQCRSAHRA